MEETEKGKERSPIRSLVDVFQAVHLIVSKLDLILDMLNELLRAEHRKKPN